MRKTFALLLALAAVLTLAACGSKDNPNAAYAGTYEGVRCRYVSDEEWTEDEPFSLKLKADGTGSHTRDGVTFDVTWVLDGESFTMNETLAGDPIVYTGTLKDGELHLYNGSPDAPLTCEYIYKFVG